LGLKSAVRHALVGAGLEDVVRWYWRARGRDTAYIKGSRRQRFETIYRTGQWTHGDLGHESLSGYGSTLQATSSVRRDLPQLLSELGASRLLDVGCGDFNWMKEIDLPCDYIGVDIVPEVIEANTARYANACRSFMCIDAVAEDLPQADVVLCREVLFHLSFRDALALIKNVRSTGARYLLATTNPATGANRDIPSGEWREINLEQSPYAIGPRHREIADGDGPSPSRVLGVWRL
jgi:SAM-dependent methyltransferase